MAYNILKGNVQFSKSTTGSIESMVDDHSDQSVGGVKTFTSALTASAFYDSTSGTPITASPIGNLYNAAEGRLAIFSGSSDLTASAALVYNNSTFTLESLAHISSSANISGSAFYGSGVGLTNLQAGNIAGTVSAANINIGNGLNNNAGALEVSASNNSINIAANGISINGAGSTSGLIVGGSGLAVDPSRATSTPGLNGTDEFLASTAGTLYKVSIDTLETYLQSTLNFGQVAGANTQVQFNSAGAFGADAGFTFNAGTLAVPNVSSSSTISASFFYGNGSNLVDIDGANLIGTVSAANINKGNGLYNNGGALEVSASTGITVTGNGVEVTASATCGLNVTLANGLAVDPSRAVSLVGGVSGSDVILLSDNSDAGNLKKTDFNTAKEYMQSALTFTSPGGSNTQVQYNNSGDFGGSPSFTFNSATNSIYVSGSLTASNIVPNADQQYNIGQETLGYENLYAKFLNGGISLTVVNDEGASITKGQAVYIKGISGGNPTVALAACDDSNKMPAFGLVADGTITNGSTGRVVTFGALNSIDTSAFSLGDTLFIQTGSGGVSGSLTNSAPTGSGNLIQNIGKVVENSPSGRVRIGGAGRTNATPNLDKGYIFIGNDSDQSVQDNTIYVSASANQVGINTTTTTHTLTVNGPVSGTIIYGDGSNLTGISGGSSTSINIFTASFNVLNTYDVVGMSTSGSVVTASLPGASSLSSGQRLVFKDVGGSGSVNNLVIEPSGSETIDGASTLKITNNWGAATIVSDGVGQYFIIGTN